MSNPTPGTGQHLVDLLVRELHRRQTSYRKRRTRMRPNCRWQVEGELIGLSVALGVALGYTAAGPDVVPAARLYYQQWLAAQPAEEAP